MRRRIRKAARLLSLLGVAGALVAACGCQSTHDDLLARGYPPAYADGYQAGCTSGRQAAGALGTFDKNVPRYASEKFYSGGWDDGFKQCQTMLENQQKAQVQNQIWNDRDRDWEQNKTQGEARAYKPR